MKESTNQSFDYRVYDLCRTKLQLTEKEAATISLEMQDIFNEEKQSWSQDLTVTDIADRKDWEYLMETNLEMMRREMHLLNSQVLDSVSKRPEPPAPNAESLQWMFTYFAFQMGGIIAVILLLLKR